MNVTLPPITKVITLFLSNKILDSHIKIDPGYLLNNDMYLKLKVLCIKIKVISIVTIFRSHLLNTLNNSKSLIMPLKKCINSLLKVHNLPKINNSHNYISNKEYTFNFNKDKDKGILTILTYHKHLIPF